MRRNMISNDLCSEIQNVANEEDKLYIPRTPVYTPEYFLSFIEELMPEFAVNCASNIDIAPDISQILHEGSRSELQVDKAVDVEEIGIEIENHINSESKFARELPESGPD